MIHLLTKEGSAPIYHEFTTILKHTYPKLDVLQELHAMQAWLYINHDKRKPFKQTRAAKQTKAVKQIKSVKPSKKPKSIKAVGSIKAGAPTTALNQAQPSKSNQAESKSQQPTPVSQALADYKAKS